MTMNRIKSKWSFYLLLTSFSLLYSCGGKDINVPNYKVINEVKTETFNKSQLVEYVVYKNDNYEKDSLKAVLLDVYKNNKDKDVFENHSSATVLAVYLFTSKKMLENDKSAWIGMLMKSPSISEPDISY